MTSIQARRAVVAVVILVVGLVLGVLAAGAWNPGIAATIVAADLAVGTVFVLGGAAVVWRRPESIGTALLMALVGCVWFAGSIWPALELLHRGVLVHLLATSPRASLAPRATGVRGSIVLLAVGAAYVASLIRVDGSDVAGLVFGVTLGVVSVDAFGPGRGRRWRARSTEGGLAAAIAVFAIAAGIARSGGTPLPASPFFYDAVLAGGGLLLALDLFTARRAVGMLTQLVVDLGEAAQAGTIRDRLARAVGDPTLLVGYALGGVPGAFVDETGRPVAKPAIDQARSVTPMIVDGREVGFVAHDPFVLGDPASVAAVSATAELALANSALQADVRRRVADVAASRGRLVRAADAERRRLEERLQGGTLRRLDRVRKLLRDVRADHMVDDDLAAATHEVERAREELANFARGVHPAALVDGGLAAALRDAARLAPIDVELSVTSVRADPLTESTAYFVCSEAIANASKHTSASRISVNALSRDGWLVVTVRDDGGGGATLGPGGGLRGLRDRVEALGGTLEVDSPPGSGTSVIAQLPATLAGSPAAAAAVSSSVSSSRSVAEVAS